MMRDQALNLRDVTRHRGSHYRSAATFACLSLIAAPGCGLGDATSRSEASVEIIRGKDSAGAVVELERRGSRLTNARVIDIVLGRGEGEITQNAKDQVEFTIGFPAGSTITYTGRSRDPTPDGVILIEGEWRQHAKGIYGTDAGTWSASAPDD